MVESSKSINYFSQKRFDRYLKACGNNPELARQLYDANGQLCNAFRSLLTDYFEVFLRNALDHHLAIFFEDDFWLCHQYENYLGVQNAGRVTEAKQRQHYINYTNDDLVATLSFGFWTELFYPANYKALKGRPIRIFTNKPKRLNQSKVYNHLNQLRQFRNRISHGEPIVFAKNKALIDLRYAQQMHQLIYRVIDWIQPSLVPKVQRWDRVEIAMRKVVCIKDKF